MTSPPPVTGSIAGARRALALAGVLFVLSPALRPWSDAEPSGAAAAYASPLWVPSHLGAVVGVVLVVLGGDADFVTLVQSIRGGAIQLMLFGAGLVLLAVAAVLTAIALGRSGRRRWWVGVPFAAAFVLLLPQFSGPPWVRIAHGALTGAACVVLAGGLTERTSGPRAASVTAFP